MIYRYLKILHIIYIYGFLFLFSLLFVWIEIEKRENDMRKEEKMWFYVVSWGEK